MEKFKLYPRVRKKFENPKDFLRLHRAEFAHDFNTKVFDKNNYYPNSEILIKEIAKFYKIKNNNILIGLGAESLIRDVIIWHSQKNKIKKCLNTFPNFFMYEIFLRLFNYKKFYFKIDVLKPSNTSTSSITKLIKKNKITLLIIVNPSHPFEKFWTLKEIDEILRYAKSKGTFVILDEVYQGMGAKSSLKLIKKYNNFVIIKSVSKTFGYPGLRIGFALGNMKIIKELESLRLSHELPSNIIEEGVYLFKNYRTKIKPRINKIIKARQFAKQELEKRNKFVNGEYGNSLSIYFKNKKKLKKIGDILKKNKIIVNYLYSKPYDRFMNVTTTSIANLKRFFKIFDLADND